MDVGAGVSIHHRWGSKNKDPLRRPDPAMNNCLQRFDGFVASGPLGHLRRYFSRRQLMMYNFIEKFRCAIHSLDGDDFARFLLNPRLILHIFAQWPRVSQLCQ